MTKYYSYGFNGKEKDDEVKGSGNSIDFGERMYDTRLGRWLSIDLKVRKYPFVSPYCYAVNTPILFIDVEGEDIYIKNPSGGKPILYFPGMSINSKMNKYVVETIKALNDLHDGKAGEDGTKFVNDLVADHDFTLNIEKSTQYNPDANQFNRSIDEKGNITGGVLKWNSKMGLILENKNTKTGNDKMSPLRVLLHEIDHADKLSFLQNIVNNLSNKDEIDKFKGLDQDQKDYLTKGIDAYQKAGWELNQDTYNEVAKQIINAYNSIAEENRVMTGSEAKSGEKMEEGTRTNYETGVKGVFKTEVYNNTASGKPSKKEEKLIKQENERIQSTKK